MADVIVTCWLNACEDPHYKRTLPADIGGVSLLDSAPDAVILSDCLTGRNVVRVDPVVDNPYFARWQHVADWCDRNTGMVWAVDAGDVTLLNDPYPAWLDTGTLYVGSEPVDGPNARSVGFWWVAAMHPDHRQWIDAHATMPLYNPGIVGGSTTVVAAFARRIADYRRDSDTTDMVAANRAIYDWRGPTVTGPTVHTPMWSFATSDTTAIWAHK